MKKILVIDDDIFYLSIIENYLKKLSFEGTFVDNPKDAKRILEQQTFDMVLCDVNFESESAEGFVEHYHNHLKLDAPLVMLSGSDNDETVERMLKLGAKDYITKPVTLKRLGMKIKGILGLEVDLISTECQNTVINEKRIGVVIPCYNEAERLESIPFQKHVIENSSYVLCFVNDGSKDNTLQVLNEIKKQEPNKVSVLNLEKNVGKAEAVRQGMLYMMKEKPLDLIGFLDADLSTDFEDFNELSKLIQSDDYDMVIGSRLSRAGAEINKESKRSFISYMINRIIVSIIKTDVKDTQCGAKIFTIPTAKKVFAQSFLSRWLFDVEIFIRLKKWKQDKGYKAQIVEYPLKRWIHKDGSKLGFKDSLKIFLELYRIKKHYKAIKHRSPVLKRKKSNERKLVILTD